jgi:hypothetical protein
MKGTDGHCPGDLTAILRTETNYDADDRIRGIIESNLPGVDPSEESLGLIRRARCEK